MAVQRPRRGPRLPTQIRDGARLGRAAFTATAEAFRAVVTGPMEKGAVSRAVSDRLPDELTYDCRALPADRLDALRAAEPARLVRLLPPGDPWLPRRRPSGPLGAPPTYG